MSNHIMRLLCEIAAYLFASSGTRMPHQPDAAAETRQNRFLLLPYPSLAALHPINLDGKFSFRNGVLHHMQAPLTYQIL
jgi:hypothetical protein